jgi:hypothetical protein
MKTKLVAGLAVASVAGIFGFSSPAMACPEGCEPPPPPPELCSFPPGGQVAPLHSSATPGGRDLVFTICSNSGRGESRGLGSGAEFKGRQVWGFDVDPGGSQGKNHGGDS